MADPVMSDLPRRWVLECVTEEFQSLKVIRKAFFLAHPLEAWIEVSGALRRKLFKEKKTVEERNREVESALHKLLLLQYVEKDDKRPLYKLAPKGIAALNSVKRRRA